MNDPHTTPLAVSVSWKRAVMLSLLAVYGPYVVLAVYALIFESSSYVKTHVWSLLPCAPGLLPVEFIRRWLDMDRPSDTRTFAVSLLATDVMVAVLFLLVRKAGWMRYPLLAVALSGFSFSALGLLGLLRS